MLQKNDPAPLSSKFLIIVAIVLTAGPALIFYINFHDWAIAKNTEAWSQFGEYLGGVVAPLLSFTSLIVLAQATYDLRERDKRERDTLRKEDRIYQEDQLKAQRNYDRTRIIFELESKWEGMIEKRDRAAQIIRDNPYTDIRSIEKNDLKGRETIYETIGFFRTLEFAVREEVVLERHAIELFGPIFVWWYIVGARRNYPIEWDAGNKLALLYERMKSSPLFSEWEKYAEVELRDKYSGLVAARKSRKTIHPALPRRKKRAGHPKVTG